MSSQRKILFTGFGPFENNPVNASWIAVQEAEKVWEDSNPLSESFKLETREFRVSYSFVAENLQLAYSETTPALCVHVGVAPIAFPKLERRGKNSGYVLVDVDGNLPPNGVCKERGPEELQTSVDLEIVLKKLSSAEVEFEISEDAGRFLCDFMYYSSLYLGDCPVIFVHLPPLSFLYTAEQLGRALKELIISLLTSFNFK